MIISDEVVSGAEKERARMADGVQIGDCGEIGEGLLGDVFRVRRPRAETAVEIAAEFFPVAFIRVLKLAGAVARKPKRAFRSQYLIASRHAPPNPRYQKRSDVHFLAPQTVSRIISNTHF